MSPSPSGKDGRRSLVNIPCDDCIKRASSNPSKRNIDLCENCAKTLFRPGRTVKRTVDPTNKVKHGVTKSKLPHKRRHSGNRSSSKSETKSSSHSEDMTQLRDTSSTSEPSSGGNLMTFKTLEEARSSLRPVQERLSSLISSTGNDGRLHNQVVLNEERRLYFGPWLAAWEEAFSQYLTQNVAGMSDNERSQSMVLKTHHLVAEMFANVDLSADRAVWDPFQPQFQAIVDLADAASHSSMPAVHCGHMPCLSGACVIRQQSELTTDGPLREVSSRCGNQRLRQRAQILLAKRTRLRLPTLGSPPSSFESSAILPVEVSRYANDPRGSQTGGQHSMLYDRNQCHDATISSSSLAVPVSTNCTAAGSGFDPLLGTLDWLDDSQLPYDLSFPLL